MAISKILSELKKTIILAEKTEQLGKEVTSLSGKIIEHAKENSLNFKELNTKNHELSDRLIRIEALVEFTQNRQPQNEQKQIPNS